MRRISIVIALSTLVFVSIASAQQASTTSVPNLIRYSGTLKDAASSSATVGVTFAIYKQQEGGAPIWMETQNVAPGKDGQYSVLLGSTTAAGLPGDLFSQQEERWLGVQLQGQAEQPRVLLVSVPYAFKAHEADTLGGLPASSFVKATPSDSSDARATAASSSDSASGKARDNPAPAGGDVVIRGQGATNYLPLWVEPNLIHNSVIYQTGGNVGIGTTAPKAKLDVTGGIQGTSATGVGVIGSTASTTQFESGVSGFASAATGQVNGVSGNTQSTGPFAVGVNGYAGAATGQNFGVSGGTASTTNGAAGVNGNASGASGIIYGVSGSTNSTTNFASGVFGFVTATTGQVSGVSGSSNSTTTSAAGVNGFEGATTGQVIGVNGSTNSTTNYAAGVNGYEGATTGAVFGVSGVTSSTTDGAAGVNGGEGGSTGVVYGVNGASNSTTTNAAGVKGFEGATTGQVYGVSGGTNSTTTNAAGVAGYEGSTTGIVYGVTGATVSTTDGASGVSGFQEATSGQVFGVLGTTSSTRGVGVNGNATAQTGQAVGVFGASSSSDGIGVEAQSPAVAVQGVNQTCSGGTCTLTAGTAGNFATGPGGTILQGLGGGITVFTVDSSGNGFYAGNLNVNGKLTKGGGSFKIDHPVDPENKYLSHSFVESPDMMNIYNGSARLNARGEVWVTMPDYFDALNRDFQYVLTALGRPQPYLYIAMKMKGNRFKIAGGKPNAEVSWQVTGIRQDAWANAHRIPVEEDKPDKERGTYLYPELYGANSDKNMSAQLRH